jgi:hypothetical protein
VARVHTSAPDRGRELVEVHVRRRQADVRDDDPRRGLRIGELGEQHDRLRLHRPADVHGLSTGDLGQRRNDGFDRGVGWAVEHDAHRALVVVLGDEDDCAREVRVRERG